MPTLLELAKLRRSYGEIRQGYSVVRIGKDTVYLKHLSSVERGLIDSEYIAFFESAVARGLISEADKIKELEESKDWTSADEKTIEDSKLYLRGLAETKNILLIPSQLESINKQIFDGEKRLRELIVKRTELVGFTAEEFANKKLNELYILHSLFKTSKLDEPYVTQEDTEYMDDFELGRLIVAYNGKILELDEQTIKKIAIARFFQELYSLCNKDIFKFFGKPIADLTYYQCDLAKYAGFFYFVFSENGSKPPVDIVENPDKVIEWYNISKNAVKELEKHKPDSNGMGAQSLVGVSKKEYKEMGMDVQGPSLSSIASKNKNKKIERAELIALLNGQKV